MSDEPALLAAILAHPDEDTPRLVYADWLDEHGHIAGPAGRAGGSPGAGPASSERAEFIRLQCAPDPDEDSIGRAFELEERNRAKWLAGLPNFPPARWEFRRGFPECLDAPGALFLERFDAFARVPWLRSLSLHGLYDSLARDLANRVWPPRWVELELQEGRSSRYEDRCSAAVRVIAGCPQVRQLRSLQLSGFPITPDGVRELAASPYLDSLERLQLDDPGDGRFAPLRELFGDRLVIG